MKAYEAMILAVAFVLLGGCHMGGVRSVGVVVFRDGSWTCVQSSDGACETRLREGCHCCVRFKIDAPANTRFVDFRRCITEFVDREELDVDEFVMETPDGQAFRFWPIGIYDLMVEDAPRVYLGSGRAIQSRADSVGNVGMGELPRLISDKGAGHAIEWACQWDVSMKEIIDLSTSLLSRGYDLFYLSLFLGRVDAVGAGRVRLDCHSKLRQ